MNGATSNATGTGAPRRGFRSTLSKGTPALCRLSHGELFFFLSGFLHTQIRLLTSQPPP
jgi:hypothetical protein